MGERGRGSLPFSLSPSPLPPSPFLRLPRRLRVSDQIAPEVFLQAYMYTDVYGVSYYYSVKSFSCSKNLTYTYALKLF